MILSCYIKRFDAAENLTGLDIRLYKDGTIGSSVNIVHIGDGWHYVWKATTGKASGGNYASPFSRKASHITRTVSTSSRARCPHFDDGRYAGMRVERDRARVKVHRTDGQINLPVRFA